ncbi:MAG: hypothetical protein ISQ09_07640 [Rubripirellula sp.]|nr:hypothetical protein [Rubripirellula sp.]
MAAAFTLDSNNQEMPSEAAFPKTANVQPNNRMPVCPNCESEVEYKGGMICPNCGFDFMRYLWIPAPWGFLQFKFQKKTPRNIARIVFWMSTPTTVCVGAYSAMGDKRFTLVGLTILGLIVIPATFIFTVAPILAFLKKDELRDFDGNNVSDNPANQERNLSDHSGRN